MYYRVFRNQGTGPDPAVCSYGHHDPTLRTRGLVALTRASYPEVHGRLTWEVPHRWLSLVLVLIFKVIIDVEHLFMCFPIICISSLEDVYLGLLPIFDWVVCFFKY